MDTLSQHHQLIELLYSGVTEASDWKQGLMRIAQMLGSEHAAITSVNRANQMSVVSENTGLPTECIQAYSDYYCLKDPAHRVVGQIPLGGWYVDQFHLGEATIRRSEFYQDFMFTYELKSLIASPLNRDQQHEQYLVIQFSNEVDLPDLSANSEISLILRHLQRAMRIQQRLSATELDNLTLRTSFGQLNLPALILKDNGKILHINPLAEGVIAHHPNLSIINGVLCCGFASQALSSAIQQACGVVGPAQISSVRMPGEDQISVIAFPLKPDHLGALIGKQHALILFARHSSQEFKELMVLEQVYDLSKAEIRLVSALLNGLTLDAYCLRHHKAMTTAKSQLQSVFRKVGVDRQSDLIRVLMPILMIT
ncbi:helix-turn-helix transcriptional regulator [Undibacterium curvum]|uniref:helix-turn-helix transcriptional regulator n=1 Tax=Undibacterium curvum TaxID=2762294 RepID=UPI003D0EE073